MGSVLHKINWFAARFVIFTLFLSSPAFAQTNRIAQLKQAYVQANSNTQKLDALIRICDQHFSLANDSLLKYIELGKKIAAPNTDAYRLLQNYYCVYLFKMGKLQDGLLIIDSLVDKKELVNHPDSISLTIFAFHCSGLIRNGQNKEAIEQCFRLLEASEKMRDTLSIGKAYNLLGWAHMELGQYNDAIRWLKKVITIGEKARISDKFYNAYSNMASCYDNINNRDSSLHYVNLAIHYSQMNEVLTTYANALNIRAAIFTKNNEFVSAENDMKDAIAVRERIGDVLYEISDMAQLSSFYASIHETDKGVAIAKKGIAIAEKANNLTKLIFLYEALGENYKASQQLRDYGNVLEIIAGLKDSLYRKNSEDAIAEMEVKYELQKSQNIITRQHIAITRSRYLSIGFSILILSGLILFYILYRNRRISQRRKLNQTLLEQKIHAEKTVELARENERKRIAADLHDNLGLYAGAIAQNTHQLRLEGSVKEDYLLEQLETNAQAMVTQLSDTIWVLKNEQLPFTGLADRFKLWLMRLIQNYPQVKYVYSEDITHDIEFSPVKILQIFLILKECINNALKHSDCSKITIHFYSKNYWYISIEDNGKGFEKKQFSKGSGISNIESRTKESGWVVSWQQVQPSGTRVIIASDTQDIL